MITIPAEALFDLLQTRITVFRDDYKDYNIRIGPESRDWTPDDEYYEYSLEITKTGFMELLLNRVFVCDEYELKIGL